MIIRIIVLMAVLALLAAGAYVLHRHLPPEHHPFRPLDLTQPIGWATAGKLAQLKNEPSACFEVLDTGAVDYERLPDGEQDDPCGFENALFLKRSHTAYSAPMRLSCPLAASLNLWERHIMQPAALQHFGVQVERVETYGSFSCRRINGAATGRWSEHATANAIDISGFRLADGRRITVLADWASDEPPGRFLEDVFNGGCDLFKTALGPDYNAAHADHFHFDMGRWSICR